MNQEQTIISYDQFMPQPRQERLRIFNEVSAENRALLIKTHVERWLTVNRSRLTLEQIAVLEETIPFITPEWYQTERDREKVQQEVEVFCRKLEAFFTREDVMQISNANFADYVPPVEGENR
jgi:hypothetical protein